MQAKNFEESNLFLTVTLAHFLPLRFLWHYSFLALIKKWSKVLKDYAISLQFYSLTFHIIHSPSEIHISLESRYNI